MNWDESVAAALFGLVCGGLLGGAGVHERLFRPEAEELRETDRTNELLMDHSDAQACVVLETALTVQGIPRYAHVVQYGEWAAEQLAGGSWPEALKWCRGER